ncbi:MAG: hypothetical protein UW64_C0004G0016 [Microgenomates group bacterium GW2011_GWC1_44_37]|uniref:Uncharacterized protein n=1 Tax=Candidatus Collierbacteria bacterium GW2011_GWB2_44_22 TaxID=1618387 RepID=A0A0G1I092_9BACT|nr:MAG: hypothetical protein UW31_C0001G0006 [Candidatus Collierbacteria bacterium GW2011_GWA2_44_13]KKT52228.1 MAG: hypothetical protein UW44_C0003G0071 [Candidatus Collierbacteria bacterium GW2011_GWB2_44_22]KKT62408.1 MAG: hypothetical protein UW56_C0007G0016 [Candidatus Collierbacteria bacterium GW2011_GWD1_44_27]KKT66830.1 MAG: hypothetical protein UW58_C0002G0015 [Candidatus Collierbacteria bacterium GW2011_GWC2_44_30]KKT69094.1 MAG: hypothetical protein UW64_C0004G0016 [Microgenomates gr
MEVVFVAGEKTTQPIHGMASVSEVDYRLATFRKIGDFDLKREELIMPGIYVKNGMPDVTLVRPLESGAPDPAVTEGLRVQLSPFKAIRYAPTEIDIKPRYETEILDIVPGDIVDMNLFKSGDTLEITDYKGRTYRLKIGFVKNGKVDFKRGMLEDRRIVLFTEFESPSNPRVAEEYGQMAGTGGSLVFVAVNNDNSVRVVNPGERTSKRFALGYVDAGGIVTIPDELSSRPGLVITPSSIKIKRERLG